MARTISAGGVSLSRKPAAPARSARSTSSSASKVVSTTTAGGSGWRAQQPGGGDAVELGHADVHEHDVGAVAVDGAEHAAAVVGLADDLDALRAGQHHPQPRAHERVVVDEQDADTALTRATAGSRAGRSRRRRRAVLELAAGQRDALGQADEARCRRPAARARPAAATPTARRLTTATTSGRPPRR